MLKIITIRPYRSTREQNLFGTDEASIMATALMLLDPFLLQPNSWRK